MGINFEDAYLGDPSLLDELGEDELLQGAWGWPKFNISKRLGNRGRYCTLTKECQRIC